MSTFKKFCKNCFHWFVILTITVAWIMMIIVGHQILYPFNPITFNDDTFPVKTKEVTGGDVLIFEVDSCKHMNIPAEIQVSYINGLIFDSPVVLGAKSVGCEVATVSQVVPEQLPAGEYRLRITFKYKVSHLQEKSIVKFTETFNVK